MSDMNCVPYLREVAFLRDQVRSFDAYPFCLPAVRNLETLVLQSAVTFVIGENATGKSTLLEAIAVAFGLNPEGGSRGAQFATRASHSCLHEYLHLVRSIHRPRDTFFLRAESFFNLATYIEQIDDNGNDPILERIPKVGPAFGRRGLHEQSHGESFWSLLMNRFIGRGFYILDEPEAALSPTRQMAALARIHALVRDNSQFLIATHSPILMAYPGATILQLSEQGIHPTKYTQTEHFAVTREFLNNHERMLHVLLNGDDR